MKKKERAKHRQPERPRLYLLTQFRVRSIPRYGSKTEQKKKMKTPADNGHIPACPDSMDNKKMKGKRAGCNPMIVIP